MEVGLAPILSHPRTSDLGTIVAKDVLRVCWYIRPIIIQVQLAPVESGTCNAGALDGGSIAPAWSTLPLLPRGTMALIKVQGAPSPSGVLPRKARNCHSRFLVLLFRVIIQRDPAP